jgi:hypothetical protein
MADSGLIDPPIRWLMFRKYLFLGLMVMLGAVLVSLMIQGRRQEKRQAALRVVEVVKQYKPTATRIIAPRDLQTVSSNNASPLAIRNNGTVAYSNPEIEFEYLGKDDRVLDKQTVRIEKAIPPGQEISVESAAPESIPEGTRRTVVKVRSAEIAPALPDAGQK